MLPSTPNAARRAWVGVALSRNPPKLSTRKSRVDESAQPWKWLTSLLTAPGCARPELVGEGIGQGGGGRAGGGLAGEAVGDYHRAVPHVLEVVVRVNEVQRHAQHLW